MDGIVLFLKKLFYLNVILATLEFLMGYSGDNIGGSFGTASGCNGSLNFLLVIISCVYITEYLEKNVELSKMSIALLCCLYLTAISELKVFFFELPVIIVIAMINAKFSFRKIVLTVLGTIGIILGVSLMGRFFDGSGFDFFSSNKIAEYMGDRGYTGAGDLSRFNAIPKVTKLFFSADRTKLFFGFGLGNCSYSSFEALTSDFFRRYEWLHYHWFADSMIYLETGLIGLIIFESFFVSSFFSCRKLSGSCTRDREEKASIPKMVSIFSVCCLISSVYNIALLVESGYLAYLVLTLPLIIEKKSPNIGNVGMENRHGERI